MWVCCNWTKWILRDPKHLHRCCYVTVDPLRGLLSGVDVAKGLGLGLKMAFSLLISGGGWDLVTVAKPQGRPWSIGDPLKTSYNMSAGRFCSPARHVWKPRRLFGIQEQLGTVMSLGLLKSSRQWSETYECAWWKHLCSGPWLWQPFQSLCTKVTTKKDKTPEGTSALNITKCWLNRPVFQEVGVICIHYITAFSHEGCCWS